MWLITAVEVAGRFQAEDRIRGQPSNVSASQAKWTRCAPAQSGFTASRAAPKMALRSGWDQPHGGRRRLGPDPVLLPGLHHRVHPIGFPRRVTFGDIAVARRFNPAEFTWQFTELFQGEGDLIPVSVVVDGPETKHALLERCGLSAIFEMADKLDMALLPCGGISNPATSYRTSYISAADRRSLTKAAATGDVLSNFIDQNGDLADHAMNSRVISVNLARLRRTGAYVRRQRQIGRAWGCHSKCPANHPDH
jgi:hypothetical protein